MPNPRLTAQKLQKSLPEAAQMALVLGSGFQSFLEGLTTLAEIPYAKIPGFPPIHVPGHVGKVVLGLVHEVPVLVFCGRAHYYEGHDPELITFPMQVAGEMGVPAVLLTNAAGGINIKYQPGHFMVLKDHINFLGFNPLRGVKNARTNFIDMTQAYDPGLAKLLHQAGKAAKVRLHEGVYIAVSGPSFETPAEIRAFGKWGADAVGMSTVPEVIVARQYGMRVAGLSCITNVAAGRNAEPITHEEVLEIGRKSRHQCRLLLENFIKLYGKNYTP